MDFEIHLRNTPPLAEIKVSGEVDTNTAERIGWAVDQAADAGCSLLALDLSDVTFIDCTGIGVLVKAHHELAAVSSHLWVTRLNPRVASMLQLTGTDDLLDVADPVPERTPRAPGSGLQPAPR